MNCETLLQYLSDYIDQDLDEQLTTAAQEHLATCPNCRVVLDSTQKTIFLYREQDKRSIPAGRRQESICAVAERFPAEKESEIGGQLIRSVTFAADFRPKSKQAKTEVRA